MESSEQKVGEVIKPNVSIEQAKEIVKELYGLIPLSVLELNSYDDRNFKIKVQINDNHIERYVLKIANITDSINITNLENQNEIMFHLKDFDIAVQRPMPSLNGKLIELRTFRTPVNVDGTIKNRDHALRLLSYIPGQRLVEATLSTPFCIQIGWFVGRLHAKLSEYEKGKTIGPPMWNLINVPGLTEFVYAVEGEERRSLITSVIKEFQDHVITKLDTLTKGVIHGDLNEQNILVSKDPVSSNWNISGILDWQDMCFSYFVFDLALIIMYIMTCYESDKDVPHATNIVDSPDPTSDLSSLMDVGKYIIQGYTKEYKLSTEELKLLPLLVAARYAQSLCLGEYSYRILDPSNEYFLVTAKKGWSQLEQLWRGRDKFENHWLNNI